MEELRLAIQVDDESLLPAYQTTGSAGLDLRCAEVVQIDPMQRIQVRTGVRIALPIGYEAQIRPRSGLAIRHGISMVNAPGTIDSDYRGEIQVLLINLGTDTVRFEKGDRIAQMVIAPTVRAKLTVVSALEETSRGEGGFGSTGIG